MSQFTVIAIGAEQAEEAYVLVRTLAPEVPAELWARFVSGRAEPGALLGLRAPHGGIVGLAGYRVEPWKRLGRVMLVDNFWTMEMSHTAPGRAQLAITLEAATVTQGCDAIRQVIDCGAPPAESIQALRNHLSIVDPERGTRFSKAAGCSCGNLEARSATELFPAP